MVDSTLYPRCTESPTLYNAAATAAAARLEGPGSVGEQPPVLEGIALAAGAVHAGHGGHRHVDAPAAAGSRGGSPRCLLLCPRSGLWDKEGAKSHDEMGVVST